MQGIQEDFLESSWVKLDLLLGLRGCAVASCSELWTYHLNMPKKWWCNHEQMRMEWDLMGINPLEHSYGKPPICFDDPINYFGGHFPWLSEFSVSGTTFRRSPGFGYLKWNLCVEKEPHWQFNIAMENYHLDHCPYHTEGTVK